MSEQEEKEMMAKVVVQIAQLMGTLAEAHSTWAAKHSNDAAGVRMATYITLRAMMNAFDVTDIIDNPEITDDIKRYADSIKIPIGSIEDRKLLVASKKTLS